VESGKLSIRPPAVAAAGALIRQARYVSPALAGCYRADYAAASIRGGAMLNEIPLEAFSAIVGQTVRVSSGEHYIDAEVTQAQILANPSPRAQAPFFVIVRHNGATRAINQGIYQIAHPNLGTLDLFLVPIGPDAQGMCYEITFN